MKKTSKEHQVYVVWRCMIERCLREKHQQYRHYGGRGIKICDDWLHQNDGYSNFKEWALTSGWQHGLQLDRIDNNGNYEPSNCRFVTKKDNARNKRNNVVYNGECAADASIRLGGGKNLVTNRVKLGWSLKNAFNVPVVKANFYKD